MSKRKKQNRLRTVLCESLEPRKLLSATLGATLNAAQLQAIPVGGQTLVTESQAEAVFVNDDSPLAPSEIIAAETETETESETESESSSTETSSAIETETESGSGTETEIEVETEREVASGSNAQGGASQSSDDLSPASTSSSDIAQGNDVSQPQQDSAPAGGRSIENSQPSNLAAGSGQDAEQPASSGFVSTQNSGATELPSAASADDTEFGVELPAFSSATPLPNAQESLQANTEDATARNAREASVGVGTLPAKNGITFSDAEDSSQNGEGQPSNPAKQAKDNPGASRGKKLGWYKNGKREVPESAGTESPATNSADGNAKDNPGASRGKKLGWYKNGKRTASESDAPGTSAVKSETVPDAGVTMPDVTVPVADTPPLPTETQPEDSVVAQSSRQESASVSAVEPSGASQADTLATSSPAIESAADFELATNSALDVSVKAATPADSLALSSQKEVSLSVSTTRSTPSEGADEPTGAAHTSATEKPSTTSKLRVEADASAPGETVQLQVDVKQGSVASKPADGTSSSERSDAVGPAILSPVSEVNKQAPELAVANGNRTEVLASGEQEPTAGERSNLGQPPNSLESDSEGRSRQITVNSSEVLEKLISLGETSYRLTLESSQDSTVSEQSTKQTSTVEQIPAPKETSQSGPAAQIKLASKEAEVVSAVDDDIAEQPKSREDGKLLLRVADELGKTIALLLVNVSKDSSENGETLETDQSSDSSDRLFRSADVDPARSVAKNDTRSDTMREASNSGDAFEATEVEESRPARRIRVVSSERRSIRGANELSYEEGWLYDSHSMAESGELGRETESPPPQQVQRAKPVKPVNSEVVDQRDSEANAGDAASGDAGEAATLADDFRQRDGSSGPEETALEALMAQESALECEEEMAAAGEAKTSTEEQQPGRFVTFESETPLGDQRGEASEPRAKLEEQFQRSDEPQDEGASPNQPSSRESEVQPISSSNITTHSNYEVRTFSQSNVEGQSLSARTNNRSESSANDQETTEQNVPRNVQVNSSASSSVTQVDEGEACEDSQVGKTSAAAFSGFILAGLSKNAFKSLRLTRSIKEKKKRN